ncbi:unnamed protein product [Rotaria sp. Silwood1]|nr:unnamed protein product [Rotaria sp. Silwood1]
MRPGPSPINSQNSESTTSGQYHHSMESASPSSTGKMMPSSGKGSKGGKHSSISGLIRTNLSQQLPTQQQPQQEQQQHSVYYNGGHGNPTGINNNNNNNSGYRMMMTTHPQQTPQQWIPSQQPIRYASHGGKPMTCNQQRIPYGGDPYIMRQQTPSSASYPYSSNIAAQSYSYSQPMDINTLGLVRSGKPMLSQQQIPNRYPINSYYSQPTSMPYPQQSQILSVSHRSLSQGTTPNYSVSSNSVMNKPNLIDSIDIKTEDTFDDPSKLQTSQSQPQQQPMFHPLLQSCSRPQSTSYYSNMPPTNNTYYTSQRSITPSSDYNMSVARGIRLTSVPTNPYGTLPVQQRIFVPSSTSDLTIGINNNNNNTMRLQSTPPPSSVTPH